MKQDVAVIFSRATAGLLTQQDIGTAGYPRAFGEPSTPPTALSTDPARPPTHPLSWANPLGQVLCPILTNLRPAALIEIVPLAILNRIWFGSATLGR